MKADVSDLLVVIGAGLLTLGLIRVSVTLALLTWGGFFLLLGLASAEWRERLFKRAKDKGEIDA